MAVSMEIKEPNIKIKHHSYFKPNNKIFFIFFFERHVSDRIPIV